MFSRAIKLLEVANFAKAIKASVMKLFFDNTASGNKPICLKLELRYHLSD